jgi:hypothetical protein
MRLARWLPAAAAVAFVLAPASAQAQVQVTPNFSITPSSSVTKWIMWMALGAIILAILVLAAVAVSYLRFAPKFFGREEPPKRLPPGTRPPLLTRTAPLPQPVGATRPAAQMTAARTATAVAERPSRPAGAGAPAATATESPAAEAPAASAQPTAPPAGEPAVQADAVGEAEVAAPEALPTAKTAEEVGAQPEETVAQAPTTAQKAEAPEAEAPAAAPAQPAAHGGAAALDQETFDRVLEEQLGKGVDRRVAEGRARAAAVVAARKKAQG